MAVEVIMPTFGLTEGQATIVRWLKRVGEAVAVDEPLFEAENEKANLEVPSPQEGVLLHIAVGEGETASLAQVVAWIGQPGEPLPADGQGRDARTVSYDAAAMPVEAQPTTASPKWVKASPIARRLAQEQGIDLSGLQGTGPGGRIVEADIRAVMTAKESRSEPSASEPADDRGEAEGELLPLTGLRRVTAERLAASARATVAVPLFVDVDMGEVQRLRERTRAAYERHFGSACSYNALIVRACAVVLPEYPALNGQWSEEGVRLSAEVNIGLAVATEEGLLVPVVCRADTKRLGDIQAELKELTALARSRQITLQQLAGGTFTVSSLGNVDIEAFVPVINPPQVAILGVGRVSERVVAVGGEPVVRPVATLCLVFDHRAVDGVPAAACLARIKALLENPYLLA